MGIANGSDAATILPRLLIGLVLSALIGIVAYRRGSLSRSGAVGTVLVGTVVYGFGNWLAGMLLVAFFISSSALSHYKQNSAAKKHAAEHFEKGGTRDLGQVLANGGAAALFSLTSFLIWWFVEQRAAPFKSAPVLGDPDPEFSAVMTNLMIGNAAAILGSLATVNADTWATELGVLSRTPPRSILTLQPVEPGASGGISKVGTLAALGGALFIAGLLGLIGIGETGSVHLGLALYVIAATLGGFIGALFDSLMGATVQAMYYSEARQKPTEKSHEADGTPNRLLRGWPWLNNDWVNFISSIIGALIAAGLTVGLGRLFHLFI